MQTTIKLIEAARYQLRCWRAQQQNPLLTLQDPYSLLPVKIQFRTGSRWPSFWLSLSEWLWLKRSQAWLPCWRSPPCCGSDTNTTDWQHRPCPFITPTCILMYLFSNAISSRCSSANWFPFLSRYSREPPWFNGTSKVRRARRHFYSRTFGCFYFHSFVSDYLDSPWE